jgi:exodeoxyribonuclease V gamma subunit
MTDPLPTGLLVLHGNRLESLAAAVFAWLSANPLKPLEDEVFLVQSNGMAEWLKMEIASAHGICAATRVELPARFLWRAYRAVLGRSAVPRTSALDKLPLTWRLMRLLPDLARQPGFEPLATFLAGDDAGRRLQLAQRLADLLDQYQVYRGDWLRDWARGQDQLRPAAAGRAVPLPADQLWQGALWRAVLQTLSADDEGAARSELHQRFLQALQAQALTPASPSVAGLPRRVVLFGTTHIPHQTLEAIAALAGHCQVLMAVPNPCRYHWADIIDGRELLRAARRRHAPRDGQDLALLPMEDMHAHGHPLLAAWGRQGRDFVRQLDQFDDVQLARQRFSIPRVDLFDDDGSSGHLLQQVQAAIRDLVPLCEHAPAEVAVDDRSIVFHVAHGAHREVEILHDQLLHLFATPAAQPPLSPRDVVVMVPDIDSFAPAIRAVFGQHARGHARHIPWGIADQKERGHQPVLVALEWLLRAPQQRFGASELQDLLDVPCVARRFGIPPEALPTLAAWVAGAGVRWGLDAEQRASLGLAAGGAQNSWRFGLHRMLLGYATGALDSPRGFAGVEPYAEIAGLEAGAAGALAELVQAVTAWWQDTRLSRSPVRWAERLRSLLAEFFEPGDDTDRAVLAGLDDALSAWLQACELSGFRADVDLAVAREAWLSEVDDPAAAQRFKAGGVTFCTLLPMRAIPFEVVCLLGMNDGDYPRRSARSDFDLMALPGQARPGDRSRRDDDRQLMLDALLSARRVLYVSWAGRSQRDNQEQPPSVLVSQLRDYLAAVWGKRVLEQRTTLHPLQPFSRRYFEAQAGKALPERLITYATEWRAAHGEPGVGAPAGPGATTTPATTATTATLASLASFVRNPVKEFFRRRLQVVFGDLDAAMQDDEAFSSGGLDRWELLDEVLREARRQLDTPAWGQAGREHDDVAGVVQAQVARLKRAGRLPMAGPGERVEKELRQTLVPMVERWQAARDQHPCLHARVALQMAHPEDPGLVLDDGLPGLRSADPAGPAVWIELLASTVAEAGGKAGPTVREDKLVAAWLRCLASAACGHPASGIVIGAGAVVLVTPPPQEQAVTELASLLRACQAGLTGSTPMPTAVRTGLAFLKDPSRAHEAYDGSGHSAFPGEGKDPSLARLFPDFATLCAQDAFESSTRWLYAPYKDWLARHVSVTLLQAPPAAALHGEGADHG